MDFRKITAIIRPETLEAVEKELIKLKVPGVLVSKVKGYGEYADFFSRDWMVSQIRIDIFIGEHRAEEIAIAIMNTAHSGLEGDGLVAIAPVETLYHIRRLEKCNTDACY